MVFHPQNIVIIYSYVSLTRAVVASSSGDFFFGSRKRSRSIYVIAVGRFSLSDRTFDANTIVIYTYDGIMYI